MELENITVKNYFGLEDSTAYDVFIDVMKPNNLFNGKEADIDGLTYDEVKTVIKILSSGVTPSSLENIYSIVYKTSVYKGKVFDLFASKNFIVKTFEEIVKRENSMLSLPQADQHKWEAAGVKELGKFSDLANKVELAQMFGKDPDEIGKWKYTKVLIILAYKRLKEHVHSKYQKQP